MPSDRAGPRANLPIWDHCVADTVGWAALRLLCAKEPEASCVVVGIAGKSLFNIPFCPRSPGQARAVGGLAGAFAGASGGHLFRLGIWAERFEFLLFDQGGQVEG